ncbi:MAG: Response regulator of zinc sigma-54-dependent two-component system [Myxococcales bacterium]|nr:Response regulator of zinc sigma-54-dependent two-component system [Myxococcales bacterium]
MSRNRRILVVDDEANARTALAELLRDEGFEVETGAHGFDALTKVATFHPHVAIADLQMPGMDGVDLVSRLLQIPDAPSVIVMTAFGETGPAVAALRAGASDYLTKPINVDELLVVLGKVIRQHELEHELERLRQEQRTNGEQTAIR